MIEGDRVPLQMAPAETIRTDLGDGSFTLTSPASLGPYPATLCSYLHHWSNIAGDRAFVAERAHNGDWDEWSYAETLREVRAVASGLLALGITPGDRVMLLSENSVPHFLLQLACMYVGIVAVPVSPAYSLVSTDFARLRFIFDLVAPRMVFAEDAQRYNSALSALDRSATTTVAARNPTGEPSCISFDELRRPFSDDVAIRQAYSAVGPDTVAKILFTSGSTGLPKGVIITQRMICSNQQAIAQVWPFIEARPPVLLDWLPWNHTFGGNHNIGLVLRNGGTLYIDGGKPAPDLIETTVQNLRDVSPTIYFNVPRGYAMLLPYLEADAALRDKFFANLDLIFYSGAALPQDLWLRLERLSMEARGGLVQMTSAWGSTETAPAATVAHFPLRRAGNIGLPVPGTDIRFVPSAGKLEMRVRGPQVTPGYYARDDLTKEAFDNDGFYCIGDAGRLADPDDPSKGIVFVGRIAEEFKLLTGTWVNVGKVRVDAIDAAAPLVQDVVVAGHDRDEIGLLIFLNAEVCKAEFDVAPEASSEVLANHAALLERLGTDFGKYNSERPASSMRIGRILILTEAPSIDANEITDKGYINQRAVLERRADLVERLYSDHVDVIRL